MFSDSEDEFDSYFNSLPEVSQSYISLSPAIRSSLWFLILKAVNYLNRIKVRADDISIIRLIKSSKLTCVSDDCIKRRIMQLLYTSKIVENFNEGITSYTIFPCFVKIIMQNEITDDRKGYTDAKIAKKADEISKSLIYRSQPPITSPFDSKTESIKKTIRLHFGDQVKLRTKKRRTMIFLIGRSIYEINRDRPKVFGARLTEVYEFIKNKGLYSGKFNRFENKVQNMVNKQLLIKRGMSYLLSYQFEKIVSLNLLPSKKIPKKH